MDINENPKVQRLFEAFNRVRRADWRRPSVGQCKPSEMKLLFYIKKGMEKHEEGFTVSELSSALEVTSPTVTQLINSVEAGGLVERRMDPNDRRVVRVKLTPVGAELTHKAMESFFGRFHELYEHLGEVQSQQLAELLEKVTRFLSEDQERSSVEKHDR
ncbi:MarR family winged helix-turn-helix transcriptional regulator [Paenibacillus sp. YPG26]|uniref:MarR family winged helix-turn-helix transcriptional regulator n=1 Tax=Paenibacillus sp. YPG26 TaxID=2878915 RepID=UPI00203C1B09|nr:MarR family winged helix-turn-helix transcriptional regulator [Paenibacillus sp. YPG26]USB32958.1 MarR family winged helix-turn-helix transcriptional regulator [Paenibacillus sp. YPG26]